MKTLMFCVVFIMACVPQDVVKQDVLPSNGHYVLLSRIYTIDVCMLKRQYKEAEVLIQLRQMLLASTKKPYDGLVDCSWTAQEVGRDMCAEMSCHPFRLANGQPNEEYDE